MFLFGAIFLTLASRALATARTSKAQGNIPHGHATEIEAAEMTMLGSKQGSVKTEPSQGLDRQWLDEFGGVGSTVAPKWLDDGIPF